MTVALPERMLYAKNLLDVPSYTKSSSSDHPPIYVHPFPALGTKILKYLENWGGSPVLARKRIQEAVQKERCLREKQWGEAEERAGFFWLLIF